MVCREGGDGTGRRGWGRSHKGSPDLFCCRHSDEKLVVHNAQTGEETIRFVSF